MSAILLAAAIVYGPALVAAAVAAVVLTRKGRRG